LYLNQLAYAQQSLAIETFRKLTTTDQRCDFLVDSNITKMDKPTYDAILTIIEEKKDDKAAFNWYFNLTVNANKFGLKTDQKSKEKMFEIAHKNGYNVELLIAQYHQTLGDYSEKKINEYQVYSRYLTYFEQIKNIGIEKFKRYKSDWVLHEISRNFYELGDVEKALESLFEAEKIENPASQFYTLSLNLIQTIYANKKDYPNAIAYAQKIYDANYKTNLTPNPQVWLHKFWQGLSSLDIADYMFELGKIKECEAYADRGYQLVKIEEGVLEEDKIMAEFEALQVVIKIKLQLGKLKEVEPLFKRVEFLKPHLGTNMEIYYFKPLKLYQNYVLYYEAKKDYTNAFRYTKLANELQDSLNRRNDKRKLWQIESRVKADNYQSQIQLAEADSRLQQQLRNAAILAMLLVAFSAFAIYRRIKKDNQTITEQKTLLEQSLGEKETLLKEIHHRVKNNLQIISGLFEKQAMKASDEVSKKLMKEGQDRVFSIALVHQNLYQTDNLSTIEIKTYLEMLVKNIEKSQNTQNQKIDLALNVDDSTVDIDTAIPLGLILNELITNAYKYAFKDKLQGLIRIEFHQKAKDYFLQVQDNGIGIPSNFDINKTKSLGLNLVRGLVRQLNGTMDFKSNTEGTVFTIHFKR
jgi:two-component sensor histidine kinase